MRSLKQITKGAALAVALMPATALAGGGWIDAGATGWNGPGAGVPGSPGANPGDLERCAAILRGPETGEDQAVQDNGWALYGAPTDGFGIRVVSAMLGADGNCRPLGFQDFIFVDGAYAGSISPELMDSGGDGARAEISVPSGDLVAARFDRWDGSSVWVNYYIDRSAGPVLVAIPNAPPMAAEQAPPPPPAQSIAAPPQAPTVPATVPAGPPVVTLDGSDDRAEPNSRFKIEVRAVSNVGVAKVSWHIDGSDDADLKTVKERTCDGDQECKETWRIRTLDSGVMQLKATAVDTAGVSSPEVTKEIRVRTRDGRPTVVVTMGDEVEAGQRVNLTLIAKDDDGIDTMSWSATGTTDPELLANHEENCLGDERCTNLWRLRPGTTGTLSVNARAKDKTGKESDLVVEDLLVRGVNAKPVVDVALNGETFKPGDTLRVDLHGTDDEGITRMWWYATDTNDVALQADHEEVCGGDKDCQRTWRVVPNDTGKIKIHAKAVDNRKLESDEVVKLIRINQ
ncbi:MAG TPA: hypothetical protein VHX16_13135 [Chloroflexota bacterium]|nr:hypothetical protein [Chloroflexota bacterium]